eukprot:TRINITY_DN47098_c0_g1_i1.p1 TRINITY_DN47098_c0_g1~~TRINITY_DN47098_c0_g1_i1.p1  ORF type:complete len:293 (+),score=51.03 TRINITY_DN47098_c0_g1_i1:57-881(+)
MSQQGTVKSFNPNKGFGFINGADGADIFLHMKSCTDGGIPQAGDVVAFDTEPSPMKPDQLQAVNVVGGTGKKPTGQPGAQGTGAHQGTVKSFSADKGFGFVVGPDGADVFLHIKSCVDGSVPQNGDVLTFDMEPNPGKPGQMRTRNVTGGTGWPGSNFQNNKGKGWGGDMGGMGGMKGACKGDGYGPMAMMAMMKGMGKGPYGCGAGAFGGKGAWGEGGDMGCKGGWGKGDACWGKGEAGWGAGKGDAGWGKGKGEAGWGAGKGEAGWGAGKGW